MTLTDEQQQALDMVKSSRISILTGAPGVGKTYTLKAVLEWAESNKMTVDMASPTGKAARQMYSATGYQASTIHRLLMPRMGSNGNFVFQHNEKNQLDIDLLVIDEASMITNGLMASVLRATDLKKTKLMIVGDHYQLPSIGAGAVLRDIIASDKIPCTELTQIQRNSGDIVKACHKIKDGKYYKPSAKLDPDSGLNLRHLEMSSPQLIQQTIKKIVCERMPLRGYDPIADVQVLSPTNQRTILSCEGLNKVLQQKLNPNPAVDGTIFRKNDKVIYTKNEKLKTPEGSEELIINGDMGKIVEVNTKRKHLIVRFDDPERVVVMPLKKNKLLLAYTITVHRFQGSESPVVVIPIHSSFNFFINRSWLYTAISRAQSICITVGEFDAVRQAINWEIAAGRRTRLKEKLQKEIGNENQI